MGILGRLSTLIKSNVNDVIDSMQDPAKEIDQMIRDMEDSARQARTEVAESRAGEKLQGRRVETLAAEAKTWEEHAMRAVQSGDDALAKEALRRKAEKDADRLAAEKTLQEQRVYADQLLAGLKALDARLQDVKSRQGTLRLKAKAAKGGGGLGGTRTTAFDDFDRMANRIEAVEAAASIDDELAGRTPESMDADRKLRELSANTTVDDALAELKKKLGG
jgi:phage shock protein A